jgi:glycosyltransferase involved in cell wall biosynthesis
LRALTANAGLRLGIVLKGYPRLSETFIAQEIRELEKAGFDIEIISLRHPTDKSVHPIHREIKAPVHYLPEYLHQEPLRVIRAWLAARRMPGYQRALGEFIRDLRRDFTRNRFRRFGQGLVIAAEHGDRLGFLYVHFIHTPASAARYGAMMSRLDWAVSAHAKDIWTTPGWDLSAKLAECRWCVTCTAGGRDELVRHAAEPGKVHLVYHGLDLSRFPPPPDQPAGGKPVANGPVRFLTVGRAVAKKGIDTILSALSMLPGDIEWKWTHIGGGPLRDQLGRQAEHLGISGNCTFRGARPQDEVLAEYRNSDIFVLPCRVDETGDRDGLPNVLVEAQSQRLPVVSTPISGITELVEDGVSGLLIPPDSPRELAESLARLARDAELRSRLGRAGEAIVRSRFDHRATIGRLVQLLGAERGISRSGQG